MYVFKFLLLHGFINTPQTAAKCPSELSLRNIYLTVFIVDNYVRHGFTLVGFQKPMYYSPNPNYGLCIFVGWLISSATLDAARGHTKIEYPFYEMKSVRKIGKLLQDPNKFPLAVTIVPIMIMVLFEVGVRTKLHSSRELLDAHVPCC